MKRSFLIALLIILIPSMSIASAVMPAKPVVNDTLTPDNPIWTGIKYDGAPVKWGVDSVGVNVNYLSQVIVNTEKDGSFTVQLYSKGLASSAYTVAQTNSTTNNPPLGISSITFQDSGIVMPRSLYSHSMFTAVTLNWSWSIITVYKLNASQGAAFKSSLSSWAVGKLPLNAASGSATYYWK